MHRYSDADLLALLADIESDRVERKANFKGYERQKACEAICAFANDLPGHELPGVLFIGVNDVGKPSGIDISDELLQQLAAMRSDGNILPLPAMSVEKRRLQGTDLGVITVMPSDTPPVIYKGRIWIRTGPRRAIANAQEERILTEKRRYKDLPFDAHPIPSAKLTDLSQNLFSNNYLPAAFADDVLAANDRSYQQRLAACKMINSPEAGIPTVVGLLALGTSPQDYLPGSYIQFLRLDGQELTDEVIDAEEIGGPITEMLLRTEAKLQAHNRTAVDPTSQATHQISSDYPQVALQQILYNAVLHRSYERTNAPVRIYWFNDRIEINSPGGPYGNVTPANFAQPGITDYRNPNVADVLKNYGFVQGFGRGIALGNKAMRQNGNPDLEFNPSASAVLCTLRKQA